MTNRFLSGIGSQWLREMTNRFLGWIGSQQLWERSNCFLNGITNQWLRGMNKKKKTAAFWIVMLGLTSAWVGQVATGLAGVWVGQVTAGYQVAEWDKVAAGLAGGWVGGVMCGWAGAIFGNDIISCNGKLKKDLFIIEKAAYLTCQCDACSNSRTWIFCFYQICTSRIPCCSD